MNRHHVLVLIGATLMLTAAVMGAGIAYLYRTDGRPTPTERVCTIGTQWPQRAPHLSTPAPC